MSPISESTRPERHQAANRLKAPVAPKSGVRPPEVASDGQEVVGPVHQADVAVLALHRLERDRLVVSRPVLFERLARAARVTQLSAPAGSGKTHLLRSWIDETGLAENTAWVSVERDEHDAERFWHSLLDALRHTEAGGPVLRGMYAVPDLGISGVVEDLAGLEHPVRLVIDDLHELRSNDALRHLEVFLLRAPDRVRVVLSGRNEPRLGLHRLRLDGALTEIRSGELAFSEDEARELLGSAGIGLSEAALRALLERTEGWAAGLRLAALSLAGHPDPERFALDSQAAIAVLPASAVDHSAMTRPRCCGSAASCTVELPVVRNVIVATPTRAQATTAVHRFGTTASTPIATAYPIAVRTRRRTPVLAVPAVYRPPRTAPVPNAPSSQLYAS
jgi:type II secretory pathway predicted ATPase ExeA